MLKKRYKSRMRGVIRGHIKLKKSKKLSKIPNLKRLLATSEINYERNSFSSFIMGKNTSSAQREICIRQYLVLRLSTHKLNETLLLQEGNKKNKIIYPLPADWVKKIEDSGYIVAKNWSEVLWRGYLFLLIGYSVLQYFKIIFYSILKIFSGRKEEPYVFFSNLNKNNLPIKDKLNESFDIVSWYIKNYSGKMNFKNIKHDSHNPDIEMNSDITIKYSKLGAVIPLYGLKNIIIFLTWGFCAISIAFFDLLRGKWQHPFILNQAILAKQLSLLDTANLAKEYLFHNTNQAYRPLWTYDAESRGSKITLYFYSTNVEGIKNDPTFAFKCMSWPRYLVWNSYQADFIRRSTEKNKEIQIANPIWFSDNATESLNIQHNSIALFGITPHRLTQYSKYAEEIEYVTATNSIAFIKDIVDIAETKNLQSVMKSKRNLERWFVHPRFLHFFNNELVNLNVSILNPTISPHRIIDASKMVISFPFTATALIAKDLGKPSCFYDPANFIKKNHNAAHGIPIISSKINLSKWISENC